MTTSHFLFLAVAFFMSPVLSSDRDEMMGHLNTGRENYGQWKMWESREQLRRYQRVMTACLG
jgi:hypothetical protein